jgi:hypothetical protein
MAHASTREFHITSGWPTLNSDIVIYREQCALRLCVLRNTGNLHSMSHAICKLHFFFHLHVSKSVSSTNTSCYLIAWAYFTRCTGICKYHSVSHCVTVYLILPSVTNYMAVSQNICKHHRALNFILNTLPLSDIFMCHVRFLHIPMLTTYPYLQIPQ